MAQFPKFVTTGPTVDIPVMPAQYQGMNLMPVIDMLQKQQLMRPAKSSPSTGEKDDFKIEGTIGQISQWQRNYNKIKNKQNALLSYYGPDIATTMPEWRKLATDEEYLKSLEMTNTTAVNKERIDAFDKSVAEKNASGVIHLGMLGRTGKALSNEDWSKMQQYAETDMIGDTSQEAQEWIKNFEWSPYVLREEDALEEANSIFANTGYSKTGWNTGWETIKEKLDGNIYGMLQEYNKSFGEQRSNYNKFGEGPDGQGEGQLGEARQEAWKRAMSVFNTEDKLSAGLFQGFIQNTVGQSSSGKKGDVAMKEGFMRRHNPGRAKEEDEKLSKTHDGYYFKTGERAGELDAKLMMEDARTYSEFVVNKHFEKRKVDEQMAGSDQNYTFNVINDEAYKAVGAQKKVETMLQAAKEYNVSTATTQNQGFSDTDLASFLPEESYEFGMISQLLLDPFGTGTTDPSNTDVINMSTATGNLSPFTVKIGSDGQKTYVPAEEFNQEALYQKIVQDQKNAGMNEDYALAFADKSMAKITNLYNEAKSQLVAKGGFGFTRTDQVALHIPADAVSSDIYSAIEEALFSGAKDGDGKPILKKAGDLLLNADIHIGETVAEGASFFGDNTLVTGFTGDMTMKAVSLAGNAGFVVKAPTVIGGQQYYPGNFVHMSKLDAMKPEEVKRLKEGGNIDLGTGYWHKGKDGVYTTGARPNMTNPIPMGANAEDIMVQLGNTEGANAPYAAPQQYYTTYSLASKDADAQKKYWKDNKTSIMVEIPQYVSTEKDPAAAKYYKEAQQKLNKQPWISYEDAADAAGLTGTFRTNFINEAKKTQKNGKFQASSSGYGLAGKYMAAQAGVNTNNWRVDPTLASTPIIGDNGDLIPEAKASLGWVQKGKEATYSVSANATGAVLKASGGRAAYEQGSSMWLKSRDTKHAGKEGQGAANQQGANKTGLDPSFKPKPIK